MYRPTASTVSLTPDFPGAFPVTPRWEKGQRKLEEHPDMPDTSSIADATNEDTTVHIIKTDPEPQESNMRVDASETRRRAIVHTPSSIFTPRGTTTFIHRHSENDDAKSDHHSFASYEASQESNFSASSVGYESTISVASAAMASTSRSDLSSLGCAYSLRQPLHSDSDSIVYGYATRSSLSLSVDLVGLPDLHRPSSIPDCEDRFFDNESLRYDFGVDLSCLSQPDGRNWTLGLGVPSMPRDPSSSDDPSSHSTISPLAASQSFEDEEESMTSIETHHPIEQGYTLDFRTNGNWSPDTRPSTLAGFAPTFHDYPQHRVESINGPMTSISAPPPLPTQKSTRQALKGFLGDVKRLGKKMTNQILKNPTKKSNGLAQIPPFDRDGHRWLGHKRASSAQVAVDGPNGNHRSSVSVKVSVDASSTRQSINSRPPTPSMGLTLTKVSSEIKEVKNIRRRTLPPAWEDSFEPYRFPAEPQFERRRPRPASVMGNPYIGARYEEFRPLDSIPGSPPPNDYQDVCRPRRSSCGPDLIYWKDQPVDSPQQPKSRWSTFSFLTRPAKR